MALTLNSKETMNSVETAHRKLVSGICDLLTHEPENNWTLECRTSQRDGATYYKYVLTTLTVSADRGYTRQNWDERFALYVSKRQHFTGVPKTMFIELDANNRTVRFNYKDRTRLNRCFLMACYEALLQPIKEIIAPQQALKELSDWTTEETT